MYDRFLGRFPREKRQYQRERGDCYEPPLVVPIQRLRDIIFPIIAPVQAQFHARDLAGIKLTEGNTWKVAIPTQLISLLRPTVELRYHSGIGPDARKNKSKPATMPTAPSMFFILAIDIIHVRCTLYCWRRSRDVLH